MRNPSINDHACMQLVMDSQWCTVLLDIIGNRKCGIDDLKGMPPIIINKYKKTCSRWKRLLPPTSDDHRENAIEQNIRVTKPSESHQHQSPCWLRDLLVPLRLVSGAPRTGPDLWLCATVTPGSRVSVTIQQLHGDQNQS